MNTEKNQHETAFNTQLIFMIFFLILFVVLSVMCVIEGMTTGAVLGGVCCALFLFAICTQPVVFVFSPESVEIVYIPGQREIIPWNSVSDIIESGSWVHRRTPPPYYQLVYRTKEKRTFFMRGHISHTRRTRRLLKKYSRIDIL